MIEDSRENLLAAFNLAYRVGMVIRSLTWRIITAGMPEAYQAEHADAVPGWLQEFLSAGEKAAG